MTQTATLLWFGQGMRFWRAKYVLLMSIFVFELGSLVCGLSKNVNTLIAGRAITGVGAAGICEDKFAKTHVIMLMENNYSHRDDSSDLSSYTSQGPSQGALISLRSRFPSLNHPRIAHGFLWCRFRDILNCKFLPIFF